MLHTCVMCVLKSHHAFDKSLYLLHSAFCSFHQRFIVLANVDNIFANSSLVTFLSNIACFNVDWVVIHILDAQLKSSASVSFFSSIGCVVHRLCPNELVFSTGNDVSGACTFLSIQSTYAVTLP